VLGARRRLAQLARAQGDGAQADELYGRVVSAYGNSDSGDPELALARANLANARAAEGNAMAATALYTEAVPALHARLGASDPRVLCAADNWATLHDQLGRVEHAEGRPSEAARHYLRSIEIRQEWGDPADPRLAVTLHSLGVLNHTQQNFADAEAAYRRALEIVEVSAGRSDAHAGRLLHDLGLVYATQGEFEMAAPAFRESLGILEALLGTDDPVTERARGDLAQVEKVLAELRNQPQPIASPQPVASPKR
jgi:tetratricopeptide (TPR) repeat protein